MKKLLTIMLGVSGISMALASSPASFPITCNNTTLTAGSILAQVQKCAITKQKTSDGMYVVEFTDNNKHKYECYFATNKPMAKINHCVS